MAKILQQNGKKNKIKKVVDLVEKPFTIVLVGNKIELSKVVTLNDCDQPILWFYHNFSNFTSRPESLMCGLLLLNPPNWIILFKLNIN